MLMFEFQKTLPKKGFFLMASEQKEEGLVLKNDSILMDAKTQTLPEVLSLVDGLKSLISACGVSTLVVNLDNFKAKEALLRSLMRSLFDAYYAYTAYKKAPKETLKKVVFVGSASLEKAFEHQKMIQRGVLVAKDLVNAPGNLVNPSFMAKQAKDLAKKHKSVSVEVLEYSQLQSLGFGAFCGVAQGSEELGCLVLIHYQGASKSSPTHALIGKGVTFDSGGLSLKPADGMMHMNSDMGGAGAVLGTLTSIAESELKLNVLGVLACAENMPDGKAQRPNDVVKSYSGKTIEILNTDAEGRLVLCDALSYVEEKYHPKSMVDIATLTGAQVVALGSMTSALYANNDALAKSLEQASEKASDPAWRMPLNAEYTKMLHSSVADICNISSPAREAGSITAAAFLEAFVKKTPWAHLDVAGPARSSKGATGRPVPLLVHYLSELTKE